MTRNFVSGMSLMIAIAALSGCVPPPVPPQIVAAPPPVAPTPVALAARPIALVPPAAPVAVPALRHHYRVHVAHPVVRRHWVRRSYAMRTYHASEWTPGCGGADRPCNVERVTVPIQ